MNQYEFLTAIGSYIGKNGLGTLTGTSKDLYLGYMPSTPYACTAVILNGGPAIPGSPLHWQSVQLLNRNPNPVTAMSQADSLHSLFKDKWGAPDSANTFKGRFTPDHEKGIHIIDENGHAVYTMNYTFATIEP